MHVFVQLGIRLMTSKQVKTNTYLCVVWAGCEVHDIKDGRDQKRYQVLFHHNDDIMSPIRVRDRTTTILKRQQSEKT